MTMNERIAKAKAEAKQKEAMADMIEILCKEIDDRKRWYYSYDENDNAIAPEEGSWEDNWLKAFDTIEAHLAKLL